MAQECAESSSSAQNWWDLHHAATASSLSSWTNNTTSTPFWHQQNPNSNSSCDEEISISTSFTNASNHSGLTVESARRMAEPAVASSNDHLIVGEHGPDNQLWSHVLFNGDLQSSQDVGENLLEALSSKNLSSSAAIFEPACDYLKKMDNNIWDYTNSSSSFNNLEKHLNGFSHETLSNIEGERLTKLSKVSNWSLAPPDPEVKFDTQTCNISLSPSINHYNSQQGHGNLGFLPCYGNEMKLENEMEAPGTFLGRQIIGNGIGYQMGLNGLGDNSKYYCGMNGTSPSTDSARNFADVVTFNNRIGKPLIDIQVPKHCFKSLIMPHPKKQLQAQVSNPATRTSGRSQGAATEGKKKRSDQETSETTLTLKKPKLENSSGASVKMHAPKVKLGDRITTLQQIVSPFGKTDTASVLYEAIQYIKFLQEQVQLLSNPYMKTNSHKDPWIGMERKEKGDLKMELRSRGLCLVPISCTPQVYRDNTGSDFWTPTYRGFCIDKNF